MATMNRSLDKVGQRVPPASEREALAANMQPEKWLALTPALSPRRGNHQWPRLENSVIVESFPALEQILPLPVGEGRGEGERKFQLDRFAFAAGRTRGTLCPTF